MVRIATSITKLDIAVHATLHEMQLTKPYLILHLFCNCTHKTDMTVLLCPQHVMYTQYIKGCVLLVQLKVFTVWIKLQGDSGLMLACREGHANVCGLLLSAGADVDFEDDQVTYDLQLHLVALRSLRKPPLLCLCLSIDAAISQKMPR